MIAFEAIAFRDDMVPSDVQDIMVVSRSSQREPSSSPGLRRAIAWSVIATCLLTGCQSLSSTMLGSREKPHEFAVDLSVDHDDNPEDGPWKTSDDIATAHANYDAVKSRPVSQQDPEGSTPKDVTSGHSFAPRRLTLRRPIPVAEDDRKSFDASRHATAERPREKTVSDGASMDVPSADGLQDFDQPPAPRAGLWQDDSGLSAWRPNGPKSADQSTTKKGPQTGRTSRPSTNANGDSETPITKQPMPSTGNMGNQEQAAPLGARKPSGPATPSSNGNMSNGRPAGNSSGPQVPDSTSEPETETASPDPAGEGAAAEAAPEQEPGVLERLRGLYAPRPSDTEKLRRQMRKLSDPFGLLKERDEDAGPTSSIEGPVPAQTAEATVPAAPETVEPVVGDNQPTVPQLLDTAILQAESELENWPRTPSGRPDQLADWRRRQTDLRLLYMLAGRSADSVRIIESLPEEEQEFWQSLMLAMHSYRDGEQSEDLTARLAEALEHLRTAEKRLQPLAQLKIRRAAFCDRIDGFGQITEFPATDFDPGQRVLIYVDVRNFRTELTAQGRYRSEFAAVIEYQREGDDEVTETIRLPQILDECDVERTDYFQSFELTIPALAGRYTARVRLRDQQSLQTAEADLEFTVRSQQSGQ